MTRADIQLSTFYEPINDECTDVLTIPNALVAYCNKTLYSTYILLERQLEKTRDVGTYERLDRITQRVFDSWVGLGYCEGGENNIVSF
jgi:hypothetical protein